MDLYGDDAAADLLTPSYVGQVPTVPDYIYTDPRQPYADTGVGGVTLSASGLFPTNDNETGNWLIAGTNGKSLAPAPNTAPSFLDRAQSLFERASLALADSTVKAGSAAADQAVASVMGAANPGPSNSNTNLANKGLSYMNSLLQQVRLGSSGMTAAGTTAQAEQKNTVALVLGAGALIVLFTVLIGGR